MDIAMEVMEEAMEPFLNDRSSLLPASAIVPV